LENFKAFRREQSRVEKMKNQTLSAKNISKKYGNRMVVQDVDISVNKGEIVGLLGPNGAGKTTTFYMITGMVKPTFGNIFLDEKKITDEPMYKRARAGVGYLAQEPSIFGKLSVEDNLKLVLEMRSDLSSSEQNEKMEKLLDELSIAHLRKSKGNTLSGGERRRVEISRALAMDPDFILLDEPFAGVDPIAVEDIQSIVRSLKEKNIGVLITDHNVRETLSITDRSYLLFEGKVLKTGSSESLANDEEARRLYLGAKFRLD
jgi:lipopolysaccharide export system ATP-binding protein